MVNALVRLLTGWLQEILELAGVACIAVFVAAVASPIWILLVVGVAMLAKSLEVDLLQRRNGQP